VKTTGAQALTSTGETKNRVPDWQLPSGVTRALWEYTQAPHIADDYDEYFAYNQLFEYDKSLLAQWFAKPGMLIDLGCGTGRLLVPFARRGFRCVGVDLSPHMLEVVGRKAQEEKLRIERVRANLVELDGIRDGVADYSICMFSTLGMIRGHAARRKALQHVRRILKPGGTFVCHVHNRWYHLRDPQGRWWLLRHALEANWKRDVEWGDKVFFYRGIPQMYMHAFSEGSFRRALEEAGFRVAEMLRLDTERFQPLKQPWLLGSWRANGWIAACR
jgi:SAM-dependent methyltransferase